MALRPVTPTRPASPPAAAAAPRKLRLQTTDTVSGEQLNQSVLDHMETAAFKKPENLAEFLLSIPKGQYTSEDAGRMLTKICKFFDEFANEEFKNFKNPESKETFMSQVMRTLEAVHRTLFSESECDVKVHLHSQASLKEATAYRAALGLTNGQGGYDALATGHASESSET